MILVNGRNIVYLKLWDTELKRMIQSIFPWPLVVNGDVEIYAWYQTKAGWYVDRTFHD